ncbi:MAG: AsnC family protein, partial [Gammaproteobacteria bacterium]|nr:AsnC family protein [Gammaproteobacteria bacterium]
MKVKYRQPSLPPQAEIDEQDEALIALIQTGLPLTARPYADLGVQVGLSEEQVINRIAYLNES